MKALKNHTSTKLCQRVAWSGKKTVVWGIAMAWLYMSACFNAKYCRRVLDTGAALSQVQGKHSTVFSTDWGLDSMIRGGLSHPWLKGRLSCSQLDCIFPFCGFSLCRRPCKLLSILGVPWDKNIHADFMEWTEKFQEAFWEALYASG